MVYKPFSWDEGNPYIEVLNGGVFVSSIGLVVCRINRVEGTRLRENMKQARAAETNRRRALCVVVVLIRGK